MKAAQPTGCAREGVGLAAVMARPVHNSTFPPRLVELRCTVFHLIRLIFQLKVPFFNPIYTSRGLYLFSTSCGPDLYSDFRSPFCTISSNGALESPCCFCLQKKMLNGANPFDSAHEAQMAHFKTSGIPGTLLHFLVLKTLLGFKQE